MRRILLGPVLCQGCGNFVYWGMSTNTGLICWRDAADRHRHYCAKGLRI